MPPVPETQRGLDRRDGLARNQARDPSRAPGAPSAAVTALPELASTVSLVVPVKGMTCHACEMRIERQVARVPGVARVKASAVLGRVEVRGSDEVRLRAVERAIQLASYEIGRAPWLERNRRVWATAAAGVIVVAAIAVIAQATGLSRLGSGIGDLGQGSLLVALLVGLAAGVSTCMALVGGLILAVSASFQAGLTRGSTREGSNHRSLRPVMVFLIGRVSGYALFGAVLGALGGSFAMPRQLTALLMVIAAIVMTILGMRLTGLSPRIAGWSPTLPRGIASRLGLRDGQAGGYSDRRAAALGAATFFLPCGFTQAIQIYALSTGSPAAAAAVLGVFALGTAPGLLAVAGLPMIVPTAWKPSLLRLVGVVVVGFALVNGAAGLRLAGVRLPGSAGAAPVEEAASDPGGVALGAVGSTSTPTQEPSTVWVAPSDEPTASSSNAPTSRATVAAPAVAPGDASPTLTVTPQPTLPAVQELRTTQEADGYRPEVATIYAGIPTRWTIWSKSSQTCAVLLIIPDLNKSVYLEKGPTVVDLPALKPGRLDYTCSMGMFWASIDVVDPASVASWRGSPARAGDGR